MKLTKRITSLILTLVMLVSLACTGVWTPHVHAEEQVPLDDLQIVHINPLYADTTTEDDLVKPDRNSLNGDNTDGEYYYDADSAGELIRDDLVSRDTTIIVDAYCTYTSTDTLNQDLQDLVYDILAAAMVHTGNPVEGDYLRWQYTGFDARMTDAFYDDTNIYATITYTMTYHSSAAQEAEMDTAVGKLLNELNVSEADAYNKLKTIYDYITSSVTYDHANLENDDYKLKHTAYAALINKTAVCQGYALLLYRLALELDVDCRLIAGTGNGDNHGWNIAKIGNYYYNMDSTWDAGRTEYSYFLVSPKNFANHTRWDEYDTAAFHAAYPMAEYNYATDCKHTYEAAITTKPTCTEKGEQTYTCSKCGSSYTEVVPATGHNYVATVVAPTCTEKGYTTNTCSGCGDTYQNAFVDATGHSYDEGVVTKEATCAAVGIKTFTCAGCKGSYTEEIPMLDHVYDKTEVVAPTCTEKGYTAHICSGCGDSYHDTFVDATGHSYDEGVVTKEPTCSAVGTKTFTCSVCKDSYTEEIPMTDHVYDKTEVVAPTCTEKGYTTHICTACGNSYVDSYVDIIGHNYSNGVVTTEPTCTAEGVMTYTCTTCGDTIKESIAILGHAYDDGKVSTNPTCTESGIKVHTCARCGDTIKAIIDPLGHTYDEGAVATEPTCTEEGVRIYTCTVCGSTYEAAIAAMGHTYDEGIVTIEPTCTEEGVRLHSCIRECGSTTTTVIPATGHHFENGACTGCGAKAVVIKTQPKTTYTKMGEVGKTTVEAEGDGLTYKWYIKNEGQSKYSRSSITGATYSCKMSEKAKNRRVTCIITDQYGNEVQTKTVLFREAASIVSEPKTAAYAKKDKTVKVTIEAAGDGLTYQWYLKNAGSDKYTKSTIKTDTYTVTMSDKVNGRRIRCVVKDKYGNKVETKTFILRMSATITSQPESVTVKNGATAQTTVKAVGDGLTYQWYIKDAGKENFVKSSITDATYTVKMSKKVDGRQAYCVVKDKYGQTVKSDIITLTMK